jgi:ABC-2 type transport system permease protein
MTNNMPGLLKSFANHQPITQLIDAVRGFLLDQPVGSHGWQVLAWCVGILVVFITLSVSLYRRVDALRRTALADHERTTSTGV